MRCAIYTRVSTEEQTQPQYSSLQTQQEICEHFIEVQREKDWKIADVYEDAAYSGKDLDRPAMHRLLYHVTEGKLDVVIAYKLDRISRSLKDLYDFWEVLKQHGVTFVSATQNFDTLLEVQVLTERWRRHYNTVRPHSALNYRPPAREAVQPWPPASATPQLPAMAAGALGLT